MQRIGSRAQVMHGNAKMTGGGLKKKDLKYNKQGKIVSKKMSAIAKKEKRLQKAGYTTKKGQFGAVRTMRGGDDEVKQFTVLIEGKDEATGQNYIINKMKLDWGSWSRTEELRSRLNVIAQADTVNMIQAKEQFSKKFSELSNASGALNNKSSENLKPYREAITASRENRITLRLLHINKKKNWNHGNHGEEEYCQWKPK